MLKLGGNSCLSLYVMTKNAIPKRKAHNSSYCWQIMQMIPAAIQTKEKKQ